MENIKVTNDVPDYALLEKYLTKDDVNKYRAHSNTRPHQTISFDIKKSNTSIVNGFRRVVSDELPVKYLSIELNDVDTSDRFIFSDVIKDNIGFIPLDQTVPNDVMFTLSVTNSSLRPIYIYSHDIEVNSKKNPKLNGKLFFRPNIRIGVLNSARYIKINNIKVKESVGYECTYACVVANVCYEPLTEESSLIADPSSFKMSIQTNGSIDPKVMVKNAITELIRRLQLFIDTDFVKRNELDTTIYSIKNETHTIGNIITRHVYILDPSVKLINYKIIHPSKNEIEINIKHPNPDKILNDAAELAIKSLNNLL